MCLFIVLFLLILSVIFEGDERKFHLNVTAFIFYQDYNFFHSKLVKNKFFFLFNIHTFCLVDCKHP